MVIRRVPQSQNYIKLEMGSNHGKEFIFLRGTHKAETGEEWKRMNRIIENNKKVMFGGIPSQRAKR